MSDRHSEGERTPPPDGPWGRPLPREPYPRESNATWMISGYLWETIADRGGIRLAVVCDTRETMAEFAEHAISLAWVVLSSAHHCVERSGHNPHLDVTAETHAVRTGPSLDWFLFGADVFRPCPIPAIVPGGDAPLDRAVDAVAGAAVLDEAGSGRLIVLITDADAAPTVIEATRARLERLRASGCGVLWLCPSGKPCTGDTFPGTALVIDPRDHLVPGVLAEAMRAEIDRPQPSTAHQEG